MNLCTATASELAPLLSSGEIDVEDWIRACLERVETRDPIVRAWTALDPAGVLRQAREMDKAATGNDGALFGVPIGVKDVIVTEQFPTQYNSPIYRNHFPKVDAGCVKVLRAAGAIVFGKTDTVEFAAARRVAATRNPHNILHTPGGSSSGSAAAVADGHVPIALGTQTGGSLIRPASYCGVFALKPTWGLVTRDGVRLYSATLDTVGWYARSVDDLEMIYNLFDTDAPLHPTPCDLASSHIALCRSPYWHKADDSTRDVFDRAAHLLRSAGARVTDLELPSEFTQLGQAQMTIMRAEGRSSFLPEYRADRALLNDAFCSMVENADGYTRADLLAAYDSAAAARPRFDAIVGGFDAVLTPSTVGEAPEGLLNTGSADFNGIWTLLHVPCVNIPGFTGARGLPVGLTLTAGRFCDRAVLSLARLMASLFSEHAPP